MTFGEIVQRLYRPLQSRKVRIAIATVVAAYLAEFGLDVSDTVVMSIIGAGMAIIGGIAVEDHGKHVASGAKKPEPGNNGSPRVQT